MFITHIPIGLALTRVITKRRLTLPVIAVAVFGAIFPDLDLTRFYFFDNHQRHHHDYWTHIPAVWGVIILGWFGFTKILKRPFGTLPLVFFVAVISHLISIQWQARLNGFGPFRIEAFIL